MYDLTSPVTDLKGIGRTTGAALRRLGMATVGDLLYHLPSGYDDFTKRSTVAAAPLGVPVTLTGELLSLTNRRSWRRRRLTVTEGIFEDRTGAMKVVWFGQAFLTEAIPLHYPLYLSGTVERYQGNSQLMNPAWERVRDRPLHTARLVPIYPLTRGLTNKQLCVLVATALKGAAVEDWFDEPFRRRYRLAARPAALAMMHFPRSSADLAPARRRLAFDELFFLYLSRLLARQHRESERAPRIVASLPPLARRLPLALTSDQYRAADEVLSDLARPYPMHRLVQGEVGSGKTLVAAVAAAAAVESGYQVLYLAPTEVLARQQYEALRELLASFGASAVLLTRSHAVTSEKKTATRREVLAAIQHGSAAVVVGTHTLLQRTVTFKKLGLVIVDEQHRFGVEQRMTAQAKGGELVPHLLSMTATPIPRTLQLTFFRDLDVSTLRSMPHGVRAVRTLLFGPDDRRRVEAAIRRRLNRGEQVFVVCPLIDPSDTLGVKAVTAEYQRLRGEAFPGTTIGLLHGQLKSAEKEAVLQDFRDRQRQILVATSVIEVGLDVPEASVIVIEGAERFGIAQLHQLRGRVGRRGGQGVCVLFAEAPSALARQRLAAFARTNDAFQLAEHDLRLRGPGEWFGTAQSGFRELQVADLNDTALRSAAERAAAELLRDDADLSHHLAVKRYVTALLSREHHAS